MPPRKTAYTCLQCLSRLNATKRLPSRRAYHASRALSATGTVDLDSEAHRPTTAPKRFIDVKHIRQNPELYEKNCLDRNYKQQSTFPARIIELHEEWLTQQRKGRSLRERANLLRRQIANPTALRIEDHEDVAAIKEMSREAILEEAKGIKDRLSEIEEEEAALTSEIDQLSAAIPNLTSDETPRGTTPKVVGYINEHPEPDPSSSDRVWRSHVHIGAELSLLDFAAAATSSGWGWYYLLNEAALLEQALVQYALSIALKRGWTFVSPPSIVYSHIASACGFQPRDQNGEQQIYSLAQTRQNDPSKGSKPELSLAATAEIPLAAMFANTTLDAASLPLKRIAVSRCYRAEAGARGQDTKGLYRVHEFTKVELFAWTPPSGPATTALFDEMLSIQTEILQGLGLHCVILEMPSTDLGASATRKRDIEAFFPSRRTLSPKSSSSTTSSPPDPLDGFGEVTSTSICTDYQTRRLATRVKSASGALEFPWTVNGTALAVPRVLAAILENGWDEKGMSVKVPEVLRPWMGGLESISRRK